MHRWIDSPAAMAEFAGTLAQTRRIGLDTEFMRVRTYWPELALLQICVEGEVSLLDPLSCGPLDALAVSPRVEHPEVAVCLEVRSGERFDPA